MAQTIRITITPDLKKALLILHQSTLGTLNTTELIKMAVGGYAQLKNSGGTSLRNASHEASQEMDFISSQLFYEWAKKDGTLEVNNIAHPEQLKPFIPKTHV